MPNQLTPEMPVSDLTLTADEVRAVLDSMVSNDHCTWAYHMEIKQVREKIEAFAGDGGLVLRRGDGETPPLDLRERAREWIAGFHAATEEDAVNTVALLLAAADDAYRCGAEGHRSGTRPADEAAPSEPAEVAALTSEERALIHAALRTMPTECRYHGENTDPEPRDRLYGREACCDTGIAAQRRKLAEQALLTHIARSSS